MYAIKYKISQDDVAIARELAPTRAYNNLSITNGERNVIGVLGEICYIKMMAHLIPRKEIDYIPSYHYDVLIAELKIDVKTKQRTVPPEADYTAHSPHLLHTINCSPKKVFMAFFSAGKIF